MHLGAQLQVNELSVTKLPGFFVLLPITPALFLFFMGTG
jgi:hypothetical protein